MDRRNFLLSAFGAAPALFPLLQSSPSNRSVAIVGAGLAGLRVAGLLRTAACRVTVLEATAVPGGRVRTIRNPFDDRLFGEAGAIRISGAHTRVLRLARELGLTLVPFGSTSGSAIVAVSGVVARVDDAARQLAGALNLRSDERAQLPEALFQRYVGNLPPDLSDAAATAESYTRWQTYDRVSWPSWLESRGASPGAVRWLTLGGDSRDLSALYVLRQVALLSKSTSFFKIRDGMDSLPRRMASALGDVVRYGTEVVRVDRSAKQLRIDYSDGGKSTSLIADAVVLAVPFSTLRRIEIRPPFSSRKARAIEDLPYFPAMRVLLQSRRRFWQESGLSGAARTDRPAEIWDCTFDLPGPRGILGATAGGEIGRAANDLNDDECNELGARLVADAFPQIRPHLEKARVVRWARESWSSGAFAAFRPGQMTTMMPEIASPEGHVHFAGEHTSPWMGWMEGALESAESVAREILSSR